MAEDRYRLAPLRDARQHVVDAERGALADVTAGAREARARLDAARSRTQQARRLVAEAIAARDALISAGSTPGRLVGADRYVSRRRHELDAALGEELRAETASFARDSAVDLQRRLLARARAEREVIERHFGQWRKTQQRLAERRDD